MNEELFNEASKSNILYKTAGRSTSGKHDLQQHLLHQLDHRSPQAPESPHRTSATRSKMRPTGVIYDFYTFRQICRNQLLHLHHRPGLQHLHPVPESLLHPGSLPRRLQPPHGRLRQRKTYRWISSLSKRFSLVEMIATGIVYVKDNRTDTYQPFISENGKYCKYNKDLGKLIEL